MTTYVIKKWSVSDELNDELNYVDIQGRAPGVISWILSLVGIEATVHFKVSDKFVFLESGSWSGKFFTKIPTSKICSISYGFSKPWKASVMIAALSSFILGGISGGFLAISGPVVGLVYYFLNKDLTIDLHEGGGERTSFGIKRSVVEGKKLDEKDAEKVQEIIVGIVASLSEGKLK